MKRASVSGRTLFWAPYGVAVLALLVGNWAATQWVAHRLEYAAQLGASIVKIGGFALYPPLAFWKWYVALDVVPRELIEVGWLPIIGSVALTVAVTLAIRLGYAREDRTSDLHGSARWAYPEEVGEMGLINTNGVVLGTLGDAYLVHDGPEHVFVSAPPRSGKGVGVIVPTLLNWRHSVIVTDIKEENYRVTAGWRARGSRVICFNPTSATSHRFNPLDEVRPGLHEIRDVQNIADMLVDPDGAREQRDHWEKTSHSLLVGALLHVLYAERDKTLAGVARFLADPERRFTDTLEAMMMTEHADDRPHPVVASVARELLNKSENERSSVLSTAMSYLGLFRDPIIAANTGASDFKIADITGADEPMSLYLVVPPSDLSRTRTLVRLILNQICRRLTEELATSSGPVGRTASSPTGPEIARRHRLLLVLDEFPSLGRLDFFETNLAYLPGYGIKALIVTQSPKQLSSKYGRDNPIIDSCHVREFFAPNDVQTAETISRLCGQQSLTHHVRHFSGSRKSAWLKTMSVVQGHLGRRLLTPDEVLTLGKDEAVVFVGGHHALRAQKLCYYGDPVFMKRLTAPPTCERSAAPVSPWAGRVVESVDVRERTPKPKATSEPEHEPLDDEAALLRQAAGGANEQVKQTT